MVESLIFLLFLLFCLAAYMLPGIVAYARGHHQRLAILVLNIFLGGTGVGWIIALVWACTAVKKPSASD